jgi:hypothetical protein
VNTTATIEDIPMSPSPPSDLTTRVQLLEQQIKMLQELLKSLQDQLKSYVPQPVYELQLQNIQSTVSRIERDVIDVRAKLDVAEKERLQRDEQARLRDEEQSKAQDKFQIKVLWAIVGGVITIAGGVFAAYATHVFH